MTLHPNRAVLTTLCVFIALGAAIGVVHEMLIDNARVLEYAIVALTSGAVAFVASFVPAARDSR